MAGWSASSARRGGMVTLEMTWPVMGEKCLTRESVPAEYRSIVAEKKRDQLV